MLLGFFRCNHDSAFHNNLIGTGHEATARCHRNDWRQFGMQRGEYNSFEQRGIVVREVRHLRSLDGVLHIALRAERFCGEIFDDQVGIVPRVADCARAGRLHKLIEPERQRDQG